MCAARLIPCGTSSSNMDNPGDGVRRRPWRPSRAPALDAEDRFAESARFAQRSAPSPGASAAPLVRGGLAASARSALQAPVVALLVRSRALAQRVRDRARRRGRGTPPCHAARSCVAGPAAGRVHHRATMRPMWGLMFSIASRLARRVRSRPGCAPRDEGVPHASAPQPDVEALVRAVLADTRDELAATATQAVLADLKPAVATALAEERETLAAATAEVLDARLRTARDEAASRRLVLTLGVGVAVAISSVVWLSGRPAAMIDAAPLMEQAASVRLSGVASAVDNQPPSLSVQARGVVITDAGSTDGYGTRELRFKLNVPRARCQALLEAMPGTCGGRESSAKPQLPIQLQWSNPVGLTMTPTGATGLAFTQNTPGSWSFGGDGGTLEATVTCSDGTRLHVNAARKPIYVCGQRSTAQFTGTVRLPRPLAIQADAVTRIFGDFDARTAVITGGAATLTIGDVAHGSRTLGDPGLTVNSAKDATLHLSLTTVNGKIRMSLGGTAQSVRAGRKALLPSRYKQDPGLWVSILTLASGILLPSIVVDLFSVRRRRRLHKDTG